MVKQFFILLIAGYFISNAQTNSNYGIKVGLISSRAADIHVKNYYWNLYKESRTNGYYSIFYQFYHSNYYLLEAELGYEQVGAEDNIPVTTSENPDGTGEYLVMDHAYDFLSLNIAFNPEYETDKICFYGIISPSINFLIKNRDQLILNKYANHFILGYNVGIGFKPKSIFKGKFFFEVRYHSFLTKVINNDFISLKFSSLKFCIGSYF